MNTDSYKKAQELVTSLIPPGPLSPSSLDSFVKRIHFEKQIESLITNAITELFAEKISGHFRGSLILCQMDTLDIDSSYGPSRRHPLYSIWTVQ